MFEHRYNKSHILSRNSACTPPCRQPSGKRATFRLPKSADTALVLPYVAAGGRAFAVAGCLPTESQATWLPGEQPPVVAEVITELKLSSES